MAGLRPQEWGLCLAFGSATVVAAAAIASGDIVLIGLVLGVLAGLVLIEVPAFVLGVIIVGTLAVSGPLVMHRPELARLSWMLAMLGVFLLGLAVLHAALRDAGSPARRPWPSFAVAALCSLALAIAGLAWSEGSLAQGLAGLKRQYAFWGVMLAWIVLPLGQDRVRQLLLGLLAIALLQLPLALYQRLVLMPRRLNLPDGVVPVDIVAGSFEGSLTGGANNNVMAFFLVLVLAGLLAWRREGGLSSGLFWGLSAWVVAPLALGETKMVILFLPLALAVVHADLIRARPLRFVSGALATTLLCAVLLYNYVALQVGEDRSGMSLQARIEQNIEYNLGERGYYGGASLNRANVIPFWWSRHGVSDLAGTLLGHGIGSAHGARGTEQLGHMDRRYPGYAIGLTAVAVHLWEQGLVGVALVLVMLLGAWRTASALVAQAAAGVDRALCRTLAAGAAMLAPVWLTLEAWVLAPSLQVLMALILGLTAWRARQAKPATGEEAGPCVSS